MTHWESSRASAYAEALPYGDGGFDVVMSCIGVMFVPHHQRATDERARTGRPAGRGLTAAYANQGGDPDRVAALDRDLAALGGREGARTGSGFTMQREYLLTNGSVA